MLSDEQRTEFHEAVAAHKLKVDGGRSDKPLRIIGLVLMLVAVIGAFVEYSASMSEDADALGLANQQSEVILALAFIALGILGGALYLAASVASVLRLWLLRQLVDSQARADQIAAALNSSRN